MLDDVVCLSHLRWGFVYQRPNHLMSRCARERRVFFIEEPVFDAATPRLAVDQVSPNLAIVVPHLAPATLPGDAARAQRALLDTLCERAGLRSPVLWFYTPMALAFSEHVDARAVVYDCMDELSAFHGAPPELRARERRLLGRADLVFTGGQSLYEAKRHYHPRVHAFPSSVDAAHFERARAPVRTEPPDQRRLPRGPRLGFAGVVDERMDRDLLALVADADPAWQVVVIGPVVKIDPRSLPRRPNLHYLGPRPYEELPAYMAGWDVALMPFAQNEATRFISPTKTLEYLAAGRPVVSTPIRDVVRPYGERGLVRVGAGVSFVRAIEDALATRGSTEEAARSAAADAWVGSTSWDRTWDHMHKLLRDISAERRSVA
jgi:glycosyltransferase involved in cell wall biosynthesis